MVVCRSAICQRGATPRERNFFTPSILRGITLLYGHVVSARLASEEVGGKAQDAVIGGGLLMNPLYGDLRIPQNGQVRPRALIFEVANG